MPKGNQLDSATILNALATLAALVDLLVEKGYITEDEIDEKLAEYAEEAKEVEEEETEEEKKKRKRRMKIGKKKMKIKEKK
jgi:polyhydroxyalkanoate synthesis regulator phasin